MIKCSLTLLSVTLLGSMVACGSSSGDGSDAHAIAFRSTVVKSEPIATLADEEAAKYCEELGVWESERLTAALPKLCKSGAWWAAQWANTTYPPLPLSDIQRACTSSYDECMKTSVVAPPIDCSGVPEGTPPNENFPFTRACQATVAEAEACHNELFDQYLASVGDAPACADITGRLLTANPLTYGNEEGALPLGPACLALQDKCPEALGGSI